MSVSRIVSPKNKILLISDESNETFDVVFIDILNDRQHIQLKLVIVTTKILKRSFLP